MIPAGSLHHLREPAPDGEPLGEDLTIDLGAIVPDPERPSVSIPTDDGGVIINFGKIARTRDIGAEHDENLAEDLDEGTLSILSEDVIQGIEADIESRREWLQQRAEGLELLGLKLDSPSTDVSGSSAPLSHMSTVRHPLLLEAILRFQANARGELLPADGPVKIRVDDVSSSGTPQEDREEDRQADQLETDFNYYLTTTASEYYPDTDRMLLMVGFGGCGFKKIYHCPIRRRPVSESVDAEYLIVSHGATDLRNAARVTHQITMRPSVLKRMQIMGAYRDTPLGSAPLQQQSAVEAKVDDIQGTAPQASYREEDQPRTIYECYCEIDVPGYEHKEKGKITGLPLPFKVTIDKDSRKILELRRNWKEGDELYEAKRTFVKYPFVPGLGFYDIGLLHILGNTTIAVTAAWREALDAGMFANFPGGLIDKAAARQNSNEFRAGPGAFIPIDTQGKPINQIVAPFPYKEPGPGLLALTKDIAETGQRVGGTAELSTGEGRQDAPVGTTIALLEAARVTLDAVHKRLHQAQAEEFGLIKEKFEEDPESFWRFNKRKKKARYSWDVERFTAALENNDLVPAADPNTSSHTMRVMKAQAVYQIASADPGFFDKREVYLRTLSALGINNPEALFAPPAQTPPQQDLAGQGALLMGQAAIKDADAKIAGVGVQKEKLAIEERKIEVKAATDAAQIRSKEKIEIMRTAADLAQNPTAEPVVDAFIDEQGQGVVPASPPTPAIPG
ncbi:hypothetical protein OIU35_31610 [Boseaceae bacterium BT-24-1]|nr:hypothetical protein [Boseaceae bacterium BT-24-1]